MKELTLQHLKEQLSYCPETGIFTRLKAHQKSLVGKEAGWIGNRGYKLLSFCSYQFLVHRLAFFYMTGSWPKQQIDHINGNRLDNRWENLRDVSQIVNCQNRIGKGACLTSSGWSAQIMSNKKNKHLGYFVTEKEAIAAYLAAKQTYHSKAMERTNGKL